MFAVETGFSSSQDFFQRGLPSFTEVHCRMCNLHAGCINNIHALQAGSAFNRQSTQLTIQLKAMRIYLDLRKIANQVKAKHI